MALLLNLDTATENASVCLSEDDNILGIEKSFDQKNHASFLQPAIKKIMSDIGVRLSSVNAVAVTAGPGSYTGLRVGLSSAKGLCYALQIPLILINTLEVIAQAAIQESKNEKTEITNILFCPIIDARRMEVYTALYNVKLEAVLQPTALILDKNSFKEYLDNQNIIFSGSGINKLNKTIQNQNASFSHKQHDAGDLAILAAAAYHQKKFADLAYSEPTYLKEFFTLF